MSRAAILYTSMSGNTEEVAELIQTTINGDLFDVETLSEDVSFLSEYDILFIGSYTWGDGALPEVMRDFLRRLLKENTPPSSTSFVFGTGDLVFPKFCRAVDEIVHHLTQYGVTVHPTVLKVEQSPRSNPSRVIDWVLTTIHEKGVTNGTIENQSA